MNARTLVEEAVDELDIESLACDYVERGLGTFGFPQNWQRLGDGKAAHVQKWLKSCGLLEANLDDTPKVVSTLDAWASRGVRWKAPMVFKSEKAPKRK